MSIARLKEIAKAAPGAFIHVSARVLGTALMEAGKIPGAHELFDHVIEKLKLNPDVEMIVHRDVHLGEILGDVAQVVKTVAPPGTVRTAAEVIAELTAAAEQAKKPVEAVNVPPAVTPGTSTIET